jgi:2-alkenal reductase
VKTRLDGQGYSGRAMRGPQLAAVSVVAAAVGGAVALVLGLAVGALDRPTETVLVEEPAQLATTPQLPPGGGLPLVGNRFDPAQIYAARADGVVTVYAVFDDHADTGDAAQGSGFIVTRDGLVLTSAHVVTNAGRARPGDVKAAVVAYVELRDGDRLQARVVGWDVFDDVALLRLTPGNRRLKALPLGDSDGVRVGDPVAAIGSPFGEQTSLSVGVVSATRRSISALTSPYAIVDAIQIDAPLNRGNSGGPLLDARGRVVGINAQIKTSSGTAEGVGFAVPVNAARRSLRQLTATGRVSYAYAGLGADDLTPSVARRIGSAARQGALVTRVEDGGPASAAGVRGSDRSVVVGGQSVRVGGDVVVGVNGRAVRSSSDLVRIITRTLVPGRVARFSLVRGGKRLVVRVRLVQRPAEPPSE